jgi:hypothetical protein
VKSADADPSPRVDGVTVKGRGSRPILDGPRGGAPIGDEARKGCATRKIGRKGNE